MNRTFWIEANEDGTARKVPHTGKKDCEFLNRETAKEFLMQLRTNNPETKFRMVICKQEIINGAWN